MYMGHSHCKGRQKFLGEVVLLQQCAVLKSKRSLRALSALNLPSKVMDICCNTFLLCEAALIPP